MFIPDKEPFEYVSAISRRGAPELCVNIGP
jgi:hypothetical protein